MKSIEILLQYTNNFEVPSTWSTWLQLLRLWIMREVPTDECLIPPYAVVVSSDLTLADIYHTLRIALIFRHYGACVFLARKINDPFIVSHVSGSMLLYPDGCFWKRWIDFLEEEWDVDKEYVLHRACADIAANVTYTLVENSPHYPPPFLPNIRESSLKHITRNTFCSPWPENPNAHQLILRLWSAIVHDWPSDIYESLLKHHINILSNEQILFLAHTAVFYGRTSFYFHLPLSSFQPCDSFQLYVRARVRNHSELEKRLEPFAILYETSSERIKRTKLQLIQSVYPESIVSSTIRIKWKKNLIEKQKPDVAVIEEVDTLQSSTKWLDERLLFHYKEDERDEMSLDYIQLLPLFRKIVDDRNSFLLSELLKKAPRILQTAWSFLWDVELNMISILLPQTGRFLIPEQMYLEFVHMNRNVWMDRLFELEIMGPHRFILHNCQQWLKRARQHYSIINGKKITSNIYKMVQNTIKATPHSCMHCSNNCPFTYIFRTCKQEKQKLIQTIEKSNL